MSHSISLKVQFHVLTRDKIFGEVDFFFDHVQILWNEVLEIILCECKMIFCLIFDAIRRLNI